MHRIVLPVVGNNSVLLSLFQSMDNTRTAKINVNSDSKGFHRCFRWKVYKNNIQKEKKVDNPRHLLGEMAVWRPLQQRLPLPPWSLHHCLQVVLQTPWRWWCAWANPSERHEAEPFFSRDHPELV